MELSAKAMPQRSIGFKSQGLLPLRASAVSFVLAPASTSFVYSLAVAPYLSVYLFLPPVAGFAQPEVYQTILKPTDASAEGFDYTSIVDSYVRQMSSAKPAEKALRELKLEDLVEEFAAAFDAASLPAQHKEAVLDFLKKAVAEVPASLDLSEALKALQEAIMRLRKVHAGNLSEHASFGERVQVYAQQAVEEELYATLSQALARTKLGVERKLAQALEPRQELVLEGTKLPSWCHQPY